MGFALFGLLLFINKRFVFVLARADRVQLEYASNKSIHFVCWSVVGLVFDVFAEIGAFGLRARLAHLAVAYVDIVLAEILFALGFEAVLMFFAVDVFARFRLLVIFVFFSFFSI